MKDDRTFGERIADHVARFGGSWRFIILFCILNSTWVIFNSLEYFQILAFDKYPFILLNLILSFIAAFQAPFIMMSQNRTEKKQDEAYRELFAEIKELVECDIEEEHSIQDVTRHIRQIMEEMRADHREMKNQLEQYLQTTVSNEDILPKPPSGLDQ